MFLAWNKEGKCFNDGNDDGDEEDDGNNDSCGGDDDADDSEEDNDEGDEDEDDDNNRMHYPTKHLKQHLMSARFRGGGRDERSLAMYSIHILVRENTYSLSTFR